MNRRVETNPTGWQMSMPADNTDRLVAAARARAERTRARATEALAAMTDGPVTVARLATAAGVSRSWIYTQPNLLEQIEARAGTRHETRHIPSASQRASTASIQRRLELAHERVRQLTAEIEQLRDEPARAYGRRRRPPPDVCLVPGTADSIVRINDVVDHDALLRDNLLDAMTGTGWLGTLNKLMTCCVPGVRRWCP